MWSSSIYNSVTSLLTPSVPARCIGLLPASALFRTGAEIETKATHHGACRYLSDLNSVCSRLAEAEMEKRAAASSWEGAACSKAETANPFFLHEAEHFGKILLLFAHWSTTQVCTHTIHKHSMHPSWPDLESLYAFRHFLFLEQLGGADERGLLRQREQTLKG